MYNRWMEAHDDKAHMVRHFLAALAYRFHKAVGDAPESYATVDAGHGIRPPYDIVFHVNGVLGYAKKMLEAGEIEGYWHEVPDLDWQGQVALVHETLRGIDDLLASQRRFPAARLERLLQGPLADSMTHVGQLAMLRRVAGSPIHAENFYAADIRAGNVGTDQPPPVSPD